MLYYPINPNLRSYFSCTSPCLRHIGIKSRLYKKFNLKPNQRQLRSVESYFSTVSVDFIVYVSYGKLDKKRSLARKNSCKFGHAHATGRGKGILLPTSGNAAYEPL